MNKNKVVLGLSGGVDSTSAAILLKNKGLTVVGLYFDVTKDGGTGKIAAKKAAEQLGIEFVYKNVAERFDEIVVNNFKKEYSIGRTPNPCIVCNPTVKFKTLIDEADRLDAHYIATGHYARTQYSNDLETWFIKSGESEKKDQSYMLYRLKSDIISRLVLPLGEIKEKETVRQIAREKGLNNAEAKDSQEICFIKNNYVDWLCDNNVKSVPGDFVDKNGKILGQHQGIIHYTMGQRKGLGITFGKPMFVIRIDAANNRVVLGDNEDLMTRKVTAVKNFFVQTGNDCLPKKLEGTEIKAKIRYAAKPVLATIYQENKKIQVVFESPQRAATPGQSIVYYKDDLVVGGGFID